MIMTGTGALARKDSAQATSGSRASGAAEGVDGAGAGRPAPLPQIIVLPDCRSPAVPWGSCGNSRHDSLVADEGLADHRAVPRELVPAKLPAVPAATHLHHHEHGLESSVELDVSLDDDVI